MRLYPTVAGIFCLLLSSIIASAQGQALGFDAGDKYVTVSHNNILNVSNAFTVEACQQ